MTSTIPITPTETLTKSGSVSDSQSLSVSSTETLTKSRSVSDTQSSSMT
eukprot:gene24218-10281_t